MGQKPSVNYKEGCAAIAQQMPYGAPGRLGIHADEYPSGQKGPEIGDNEIKWGIGQDRHPLARQQSRFNQ
jgi:hypothetical protein